MPGRGPWPSRGSAEPSLCQALPEAWVEDPLHRHGDEGVGPVAVEVGDLGPIGALHERPHLVDGPNLVERKVHDHTPHDRCAPPFSLTSRWKPTPPSASLVVGQNCHWPERAG